MATAATTDPLSKAEADRQRKLKRIVWRDFSFLVLGMIAAFFMSLIELHAGDAEIRGGDEDSRSDSPVIDAGYIATTSCYKWLKANRGWNDFFAFVNTIIGVFGPTIYMLYQTFWRGDYETIFRYGAISALRSYCGWYVLELVCLAWLGWHGCWSGCDVDQRAKLSDAYGGPPRVVVSLLLISHLTPLRLTI